MVFHTLRAGGAAIDQIVGECDVAAGVDNSLVEFNDLLNDGLRSAGPDRSKSVFATGVPVIFAAGNADFICRRSDHCGQGYVPQPPVPHVQPRAYCRLTVAQCQARFWREHTRRPEPRATSALASSCRHPPRPPSHSRYQLRRAAVTVHP